jgi:hypothetical protein
VSDDLPGFDFDFSDKPKAEILSAEQLGMREAIKALGAYNREKRSQNRVFEMTPEGAVKAHGYTPDEVEALLRHYREHVIAFGRSMKSFEDGTDEYSPGGYQ